MLPIKKQLEPTKFKEVELHKSAGILDDYAVRKDIQTRGINTPLIKSHSGEISFDNENLTTTGKITTGELQVDTINIIGNDITDSTGTIQFGNEIIELTNKLSISVSGDAGGAYDTSGILANCTTTEYDGSVTKTRNLFSYYNVAPSQNNTVAGQYIALGGRLTTPLNHAYSIASSMFGVAFDAYYRGSSTCTEVVGAMMASYLVSGSGALATSIGCQVRAGRVSSSGSVTNAYCVKIEPYNNATGGGNITSVYGIYYDSVYFTKNATNEYGIYLEDINHGNTLNYSIYTNAGLVRFGGNTSTTGNMEAATYSVGGTAGFTGTGAYTNFTIVNGIITNAS
jgi:hypothetical protein